jgi:hypothetical protein
VNDNVLCIFSGTIGAVNPSLCVTTGHRPNGTLTKRILLEDCLIDRVAMGQNMCVCIPKAQSLAFRMKESTLEKIARNGSTFIACSSADAVNNVLDIGD